MNDSRQNNSLYSARQQRQLGKQEGFVSLLLSLSTTSRHELCMSDTLV